MIRDFPARRPRQPNESGAAMLIAIFALLLISVVAIALVVSSGTDSSLAGNYRTASSAYYSGVAGLEEARGRLLWKNPDFINKTGSYTNVLFDATGVLPLWCQNQVLYITNPGPGETVDPTSSNPANYPDTEYANEFPGGLAGVTVTQIPSVYSSGSPPAGLPGPAYKWVRINPINEKALNIDVNGNGIPDLELLYYDPAFVNVSSPGQPLPSPGLVDSSFVGCPILPLPTTLSTAAQALSITALAVAPNGGKRLLQYVVAPLIISPDAADQNFPAALTLDGNGVTFDPPGTPGYLINGQNGVGCPSLSGSVNSVGVTNNTDYTSAFNIMSPNGGYYPGAPVSAAPNCAASTPSLANLNIGYPNSVLRQSWLTPAYLDSVMQDIESSADVVLNGTVSSSDIQNAAPAMFANNNTPMTIVVNGNLRLNSGGPPGNGLLLVTGTLTYDSEATWNGIVLVVGQGIFAASSMGSGNGGFNGTVFVAQTRDSSGNLLPGNNLGSACFGPRSSCGSSGFGGGHHHGFGGGWPGNPGFGIIYNSASVALAHGPLTYKILSFHEIPLPN